MTIEKTQYKKTKHVFVQGKVKWCKTQAPNKYGNWSTDLYPTAESRIILEELKSGEAGIKNDWKHDDDGDFMSFSRPTQRVYNGKTVGFAPPEVLGSDNNPLRDVLVGNGSDVTLKLEVYPYRGGKGTAARLMAIKVDNLIPFEIRKDFDEDQKKQIEGITEVPSQPLF